YFLNLKTLIIKKMAEYIEGIMQKVSSTYKKRAKQKEKKEIEYIPDTQHKIIYDSASETLEPIYFYVIDLMENDFGLGPVEKLVDNFTSSPGSGHFGELGQRATIMQQQAGKIMGDINTVLRSVLNIIYDLKEFKIRLQSYEDLKDKDKREGALLSLKQIWMDKVDAMKGNSSIKAMALSQAGFQTLIDAFLVIKDESLKDSKGNELDLNERVKRILRPRIADFNAWVKHSKEELVKRYKLEKNYLRSQNNSLRLYSRWVKPYLLASQQLENSQIGGARNPSLVKTFNTILLELCIMGKQKLNIAGEAASGNISPEIVKIKTNRDFYNLIFIDFNFRGIPQKVSQQSYAFGGRAEVTFTCYTLNQDELDKFEQELKKSETEDVLKLIEGATTESLEQLQKEIDYFLNEKSEEEEKQKNKDTSNPFLALLGVYNKKDKKTKEEDKKEKPKVIDKIKSDSWSENKFLRPLATSKGKETTFSLFDVYKKSHKMESYT
ncbi:MAG: hypothetical protein OQK82_01080, partial [Candidatus Pacearchaeota archaeon]|nr:hypothetical protein [Candidatus Pacearchaeota archaeon]